MVQAFTSLSSHGSERILCYYANTTTQLQIARITDIPGWRFERLIFPGQRVLFEAIPAALLKIYAGTAATVVPLEQIPCFRLQVNESPLLSGKTADHPVVEPL